MSLRSLLGLGGKTESPLPTAPIPRLAPPSVGVGLYGKLPIQADFVRLNAGGFAAGAFDQWLEEGVGAVHASRGTANTNLITFFAHTPTAANACIGMIGPSQDKVGRSFPAALFAYVDAAMMATMGAPAFAADAFGAFLFEAQAHVANLPQATAPPDLAAFTLPDASAQLQAAEDAARSLAASNLHEALTVVFGPAAPEGMEHALATCLGACTAAKGHYPDKAQVTIDLPADDDRARDFWLAFVNSALAWPTGAPSWLWDSEGDRLILGLGPPTPALFVALSLPEWGSGRHWRVQALPPATTTPALNLPEAARQCLTDPAATVGAFLQSISQSSSA